MGEGDPVTPNASLGSLWTAANLKAFRGVRRVVDGAVIVNTARALRLTCDMVEKKKGETADEPRVTTNPPLCELYDQFGHESGWQSSCVAA